MQNIFITRRHSKSSNVFKEIYSQCNIYLTDSRLRSDEEPIYPIDLSIIFCNDPESNRELTSDWLNRITSQIRKNSKQVIVLLYIIQSKLDYEFDNMKVICIYETIDNNQDIIKQLLL
jgi:hypothetical protein